MTRRLIVAIVRFSLRVYFRQIEVVGLEHVPLKTPVIFVLNHPNALVDPVFLLCLAPRRVSFLAKAPLFRMPILGSFVRALDSLPVYRRQDEGEDVARNNETFQAARRLLARGGTIGICPEGVSHNEPRLRPIKTGAARIALGAISTGEVRDLKIIPAGLYYTAKTMFRSEALLYFGAAIDVTPSEVDSEGNPPRAAVRELSEKIESALRAVIFDAEHEEALHTISRAERIFSSETKGDGESLAAELQLLQRFGKAYAVLRENAPERLRKLEVRMIRFEEELRQARVDPEELMPPGSTLEVFFHLLTRSTVFTLLALPAVLGALIHYPAYRLGGYLATRFSQASDDVISTIKIVSAMLLFPLTWLGLAIIGYELIGWVGPALAFLAAPGLGYLAIIFFEAIDKFLGGLRALSFFLMKRRFYVRLLAERKAIRHEILALGEEVVLATR
ncbi:MAG TPA: lysophospholipid acyltransferase family protein [Pyrinomonadaceae bacterium]|nr:lysophospholipid acyltransferase family protein [Pyrinomonadaceae bacterium]